MKGKWRYCSLREVADIYNGCDYKHNPIGEEYPIYGTGGEIGRTGTFLNSGSAILTGRKGSINNPFYVEGKFWHVDTIFCIKAKDKIDIKLLYYLFKSKDLSKLNEATGVPSVTSKALYNLIFSFPLDIVSQQHIADILTSCDEVIEQTEKAIAKYQAIKAGMLQDLFSRGVDANGKLRPTPEEAPELYKDSPLGKIPKEWDILPLSELVEFIRNGTTQPQTPFVTEYPVSRIETISEGIIDYQHVGYLSQNAASYKMEVGDILFSHINSLKHIGKVALKNDDKLLFHGMNLLLIRCNNKIEATFLYYLLQRHKMVFERIANSAVNQASINQTELQKIILAKPMHNEQKTILKILAPIEKIIQKEYCSLNKYISIKQGLMKKLLTPPEGALEA